MSKTTSPARARKMDNRAYRARTDFGRAVSLEYNRSTIHRGHFTRPCEDATVAISNPVRTCIVASEFVVACYFAKMNDPSTELCKPTWTTMLRRCDVQMNTPI
jgi:hypothetical protein